MNKLSIPLIEEASNYIKPFIRRTPMEYSPSLSEILAVPVYLKLECLQITGSFKLRGALFRMEKLSSEEKRHGIIACSAGNHGKAIAYVAKKMGINAEIFVPKDVDEVKYQGILSYGAKVIRSNKTGYDHAEELARKEAEKTKKEFLSPFDDILTMAGNGGTIGVEIWEEKPDIGHFVFPVGGGGLAAGFSYYLKEKNSQCSMIGCQHEHSAGLKLSLERGEAVTKLPEIETIAGGIEGGLGAKCFPYLQKRIDHVALVSEEEIKEGVRWMLRHHQYLIEPSSAASVAACIFGKLPKLVKPMAMILTGRNVSETTLKSIVESKSTSNN
jgi:threonine dehydratase